MNLELQNLDEENIRTQDEIENIKKSIKTIEEDIDREKGIVIDANSNEKRLKEEKKELIEVDSKYFETEKLSNEDLENAKNKLKEEQKLVDEIINNSSYVQTAYFHLHPSITNLVIDYNKIIIEDNIIVMLTGTNVIIQREMYDFAEGFNKTRQALRIKVSFESNLETDIQL